MKKSKQKKIKKLKKISVIPHIVIMLLLIVFVGVMSGIMIDLFFTMLIDNNMSEANKRAVRIAAELNGKIVDGELLLQDGMYPDDEFAVLDTRTHEYLGDAENIPDSETFVSISIGDNNAFIDEVNNNITADLFEDEEVDVKDIVWSIFNSEDVSWEDILDSEKWDNEMFSLHVWLINPVNDERYNLFYGTEIELKVREVMYLISFATTIGILILVPTFLYIITLAISIGSQRKSAKLLYYDSVTEGNNWLYFEEKAGKLLKKNKKKYAIACLRMEKYQNYCTCYGTNAGEAAMIRIYTVLSNKLKRNEYFARYSEAEFGFILSVKDKEDAEKRIAAIISSLEFGFKPKKATFSVGLCEVGAGAQVEEIYSNASLARRSGASKIAWFDEKIKEEQLWEQYVEDNMDKALKEGELHVYLQPKYSAGSERLGGAEALIRWISPTKGFIGPGKFIPIFEKNGFITKIDDFMLSSVAKLQSQWVAEGKNVVPISVNISRAHFTQDDLAEHICKIVDDAGAPKELIELELTESAFFEDKEVLINTVEKLKEMGFKVSMDDFGAGYSSLNSLKDLKLDVLKIDADFFRGKEENEDRGSLIVTETIQLAKSLGMTTVAEGIESKDQVEFLAKSGCDLIQGYYFAKPMPVDEYIAKMDEDEARDEEKKVDENTSTEEEAKEE